MIQETYVDVSHVPLVQLLQANYHMIKEECQYLFAHDGDVPKINAPMAGQDGRNMASVGQPKYTGKNASLHIKVVADLLDPPEMKVALANGAEANRERRRKLLPRFVELISPWWDQIGNIGFNKLFPGAVITPHYGVKTAVKYIRVHLCLAGDPGATFYAENSPSYTWQDGQIMAFNDGTVLHWVKHEGTQPRTILSIDLLKELVYP